MKKVISYPIGDLLPLTEEREAELEALAKELDKIPDSEIDFTDSPEITPERWAKGVHNPNRGLNKQFAKAR